MNDWLVAGINNPDFTNSDFKSIADMNKSNTQMLKKDEYLKSNFIKNNPLFQTENGKFDQKKFDDYYNSRLAEYKEFTQGTFYDGPELDPFSTFRTAKSKLRDQGWQISLNKDQRSDTFNPDRRQIGIEGVNVWSDPTRSKSEIAQSQRVWNSEKQEWEDYSPDDHALFSKPLKWIQDLFKDPLVLATWDEEGVDPKTGIKHKKGDYKYNEDGTYYYETLNGRSPLNKQVLSHLDLLTAEGSTINKYDFIDSDDLEKSIPGVLAKNILAIAPLFTPAAGIYADALIARELAKTLPMVYDMTTSLFGTTETLPWLNTIAGAASSLTSSQSEYSRENQLSFENLAGIVSDVALQWGQQKRIAETIGKLRGGKNYIDEAYQNAELLYKKEASKYVEQAAANPNNWMLSDLGQAAIKKFLPDAKKAAKQAGDLGRDLSLAYMALVSNSDIFQDAVDHGATRREAAAIAFGSILGMYAVDKTGIGELFFEDATEEAIKNSRKAIRREIKLAQSELDDIAAKNIPSKNKMLQLISTAANKTKQYWTKFSDDVKNHTTNLTEKMIGEGIEEVSEDFVQDAVKGMYELAGALEFNTSSKDLGAFDNAWERYGMSFLGGAIGGGVFYGKEAWDGRKVQKKKDDEQLATLIRNGHVQDLYDELNRLEKQGKVGDKNLSAVDFEDSPDSEVGRVWLSAKNEKDSQNARIANLIKEKITAIDAVLNNNQLNLSDDELFKTMVLGEERYRRFQDISGVTDYYKDFNKVMMNIIAAENNYKKAQKTVTGDIDGKLIETDALARALNTLSDEEKASRQENILNYKNKLDEARQKKLEFLSGATSLDYTRKLNFALDPILSDQFLPISFEALWKEEHTDKTFDDATEEEQIAFLNNYAKKKNTILSKHLSEAWESYKEVEKLIAPELANISNPEFKTWSEKFNKILESPEFDVDKYLSNLWNDDTRLEDEDDTMYEFRNKKLIDTETGVEESDENFVQRKNLRKAKIFQHNLEEEQNFVNGLKTRLAEVGNVVDPNTMHKLKLLIGTRVADVRKRLGAQLTTEQKQIFKSLKLDASNGESILNDLLDCDKRQFNVEAKQALKEVGDQLVTNDMGEKIKFSDFVSELVSNPEFAGLTLEEFLSENFLEENIDEEAYIQISQMLADTIAPIFGSDIALTSILADTGMNLSGEDVIDGISDGTDSSDQAISNYQSNVENFLSTRKNTHMNLINQFKTDAIVDFNNTIKATVRNPVIELVKNLSGKTINNKEIPEIQKVLEKIEEDYDNIDDISELTIDGVQLETLNKVKDLFNMANAFVYAASAQPTSKNAIGHNKMINEFAKNHSDLIENWEELPEIDSDYATVYTQALASYSDRVHDWIEFATKNAINKRAQFVQTDKHFSKALFDWITTTNMKFTVGEGENKKEYDLFAGGEVADEDTRLFEKEQAIYNNFQKALEESHLSLHDFLEQSKIFSSLLGAVDQNSAQLTPTLEAKDLTSFDKAIYLAQILSLNPSEFYSKLKAKVKVNEKTAPIATQEYGSRLIAASLTQQFRDILSYLHGASGNELYNMSNSIFVNGVAGAGKTAVVISSIKDYVDPSEIIAVGPTERQADEIKKNLGVDQSLTISQLLKKLIGEEAYREIQTESKKAKGSKPFDGKYFTYKENADGFAVIKLKSDAPIVFNDTLGKPKVIVVDEATHLSTLEAEILNEYMKSIGGTLVLAGDLNQNGFNNGSQMSTIEEYSVFMARAPKLTVSLRDNNIQKQENLVNVRSIVDTVRADEKGTLADYEAKINFYKKLAKSLNFRSYVDANTINGDVITKKITPELKTTLKNIKAKNPDVTIGYIGKPGTDAFNAISELNPTVLTIDSMQGQEFDYVIIDQDYKPSVDSQHFLRDISNLYTLMSRGKSGSIFIDNGLSDIIGKNFEQSYTAFAPNINDKVNGVSALEQLRELKLKQLEKFKLQLEEKASEKGEEEKKSEPKPDDFIDPDKKPDKKAKKLVEEIKAKEDEVSEELSDEYSEFSVPIFSGSYFLSVDATDSTRKNKAGQEARKKLWTIKHGDTELRNLQAIYDDGTKAFWYREKVAMQKSLARVRSFITTGHTWNEVIPGTSLTYLPTEISRNFKKEDWENGTYHLEIREANEVKPIGGLKEIGIKFREKRYIVELVFQVKNKDGKLCKFDLGGINDPATLAKKQEEIKNNLQKKIDSKKYSAEEVAKFQNIIRTLPTQKTRYEQKFKEWIDQYEKDGVFDLDVSDIIERDNTTRLRPVEGLPLRLGGKIDPDNIREANVDNLIDQNPDFVFSEVYTYASEDIEGIDLSVKGKAVVFVSSDVNIPKDKLKEIYKLQKSDPKVHKPLVRMIVLDNYGMNLSQLCDADWIDTFKTRVDEKTGTPFRQNYTGMQMFVSLWNSRAALKRFNDALTNWQSTNGFSDDYVNKLTEAAYRKYQDKTFDISTLGVNEEDLKKLDDFNSETLKEIPLFKLGFSEKNNYHIQEFATNGSGFYKKNKAKYIVLNPLIAKKFLRLNNDVLDFIVTPTMGSESTTRSGKKIIVNGHGLDAEFTKPGTSDSWNEDEFIDFENAQHRLSISKMFKSKHGIITVNWQGKEMKYSPDAAFSAIPRIISSLISTTAFYQYEPGQLTSGAEAKISYPNQSGVMVHGSMNIGTWWEKTPSGDVAIFDGSESEFDKTVSNFFDLIFHGTTEDVHGKWVEERGKKILYKPEQADLVRFPNGIYIHPDAVQKGDAGYMEDTQFIKLLTHLGLFTSNVKPESVRMGIPIEALLGKKKPKKAIPVNQHIPETPSPYKSKKVTYKEESETQEGYVTENGILIPENTEFYLYDKAGNKYLCKSGHVAAGVSSEILTAVFDMEGKVVPGGISLLDVISTFKLDESDYDYASIEEKKADPHPYATKLLKDYEDDLEWNSDLSKPENITKIIKFVEKKLSASALENAVTSGNYDIPYSIRWNGTDFEEISFREWFKQETGEEPSEEFTGDVKSGLLFNNNQYKVTIGNSVEKVIQDDGEAVSRLKTKVMVDGKSVEVGNFVRTLLSGKGKQGKAFVKKIQELFVENDIDIAAFNVYAQEFNNILNLTDLDDASIKDLLNQLNNYRSGIYKDVDTDDGMAITMIKDLIKETGGDDLFNTLFSAC